MQAEYLWDLGKAYDESFSEDKWKTQSLLSVLSSLIFVFFWFGFGAILNNVQDYCRLYAQDSFLLFLGGP